MIYIGPLSPGRYDFFGEYHPNSAKGVVIVSDVVLYNEGQEYAN